MQEEEKKVITYKQQCTSVSVLVCIRTGHGPIINVRGLNNIINK